MVDPKAPPPQGKPGAEVDFLVDERGSKLDVPDNSQARATANVQRSVGSTSPSNWWRIGLVVLGALALVILLIQLFGGTPGTDVQPGTPVAEPVVPAPQP